MLDKIQIERVAEDYLIKNNYPIVTPGAVTLPHDDCKEAIKRFLTKNNFAAVSYASKYLDDPDHELDPGVYIVYVNILTGEVYMPKHM